LCLGCHKRIKSEISNLSHHPLNEKKIVCTDCHNPHGSVNDRLLKKGSVRETCSSCHTEKGGPYVFEHADLMEDCGNCHVPHGSMNDNLLKVREPMLCLRCHEGHHSFRSTALTTANKAKYYNRCTDCHLSIHGTDTPSGGVTTLPKNQGRMLR
jgi:DmsE family decaheme c-type cytochrome